LKKQCDVIKLTIFVLNQRIQDSCDFHESISPAAAKKEEKKVEEEEEEEDVDFDLFG